MSTQHTHGRMQWRGRSDGSLIYIIGSHETGDHAQGDIHASATNLERIAACWNACDGIPTFALELMTGDLSIYRQITTTSHPKTKPETRTAVKYRKQRDELLAALVAITEDKTPWGNAAAARTQIALEAIAMAKAKGVTK